MVILQFKMVHTFFSIIYILYGDEKKNVVFLTSEEYELAKANCIDPYIAHLINSGYMTR
jgi:hypothetical protein